MAFTVARTRHGAGVRAAAAFAAGDTVLAVPAARLITYRQLLRKRAPDNPVQVSARRYLDWGTPAVLLNHSCSPNVGLTAYPAMRFVALRPIRRGEELRWDYSTSMDADSECSFLCTCRSRGCRKTIAGFATLPKRLAEQYIRAGVVQRYLT